MCRNLPSRLRRCLAVTVVAAIAAGLPAAAHATFPGENGKIAFVRDGDIWAINADGSGLQQITTNPANDWSPAWSADGSEIVFIRLIGGNTDVYRFTVGGSTPPVRLTTTDASEFEPTWSPDGRIAFVRFNDTVGLPELWAMNRDGSSPRRIAPYAGSPDWSPDGSEIAFNNPDIGSWIQLIRADGTAQGIFPGAGEGEHEYSPSWSPSGAQIAFSSMLYPGGNGPPVQRLMVGRRDGTPVHPIATTMRNLYFDPSWSPDGRQIAFAGEERIWVIGANGSDQRAVTREGVESSQPAWQPLPRLNPAPAVTSLSPASVPEGSAGLVLVVNGSGFVDGSVVRFNGEARPTTRVSAGRLHAEIAAADLAVAGQAQVTVQTPAPGGGLSAPRVLTIQGPSPVQAPRSLSAPVVSGTLSSGGRLACATGTWDGAPTAFRFAWLRDGVIIPGARDAGYTLIDADAGRAVACRVEAVNAGGTSAAVSAEALVAAETATPSAPVPVGTPVTVPSTGTLPPTRTPARPRLVGFGGSRRAVVGRLVRINARFTTAPAGRVVLQRKLKARFVTIGGAKGARLTRIALRPTAPGRYVLRIRFRARAGGALISSRAITLTVAAR